jgi:hypothetical protein
MIAAGPRVRRLLLVAVPVALVAGGLLLEASGAFAIFRFAVGRAPHDAPSARVVSDDERSAGTSVVSVFLRPRDLHGRLRGLLTNPRKSGDEWERPAWVSFFEQGRLVHSAPAGARIHGGSSRELDRPQSFRLYFRRKYGARELPGAIAFGENHTHPLRRLVLHNDARHRSDGNRWQFANPLAYDIARQAGALAPPTRPVRFLLNGEFQGVYVLTEHLHARDYFEAHPGHRMRDSLDEINALFQQIRVMSPVDMATAGQLVDLDSLTRWFIAVVFSATGDAYQEPGLFRDPAREAAQWFWVNWDMDGSFRHADQDSFSALLSRTGARRARRPNDARPYLITTLLDRDPEYRAHFMRVWTDVMNHALTPEFLDERFAHYDRLTTELGIDDRRFLPPLRRFLTERPARVWAGAEKWLSTGPAIPVALSSGDVVVRVDGRAVARDWLGRYFPGTAVTLDVAEPSAARFSHWLVNGRPVHTRPLSFEAREPLVVEVVLK